MSEDAPAPLGTIAHYTLLEQLDPAGPGVVYRARDTKAGRTVAVRLLPADFPADSGRRAALLEKARALTALSHPNVIATTAVHTSCSSTSRADRCAPRWAAVP
jgi:serine/threonine protein kinase